MRAIPNPLSAAVLCLMLVLTGQGMAVARGATGATDRIVICTGSGPVTIYMDAQGNPTVAPHHCPECVLSLDAQGFFRGDLGLADAVRVAHLPFNASSAAVGSRTDTFRSRAPPVPD